MAGSLATGAAVPRRASQKKQAERERLAAKVKKLEAQRDKAIPTLAEARDEAKASWDQARDAAKIAEDNYRQAKSAESGACHQFDTQIARLNRQLIMIADERIDEAINRAEKLMRENRHREPKCFNKPTGKWYERSRREVTAFFSDLPQIRHRANALRDAINQLESLKIQAVKDVQKRIDAIFNAVPEVGSPQKVTEPL